MKAVLIVYNQAHTEKLEYVFERLNIRGFTKWPQVFGRGSENGEPHMGTHTWPEANASILTVIKDEEVNQLLEMIKKVDAVNQEVGIRAFVWNIEAMV